MTYRGHVRNGKIELEDAGELPEGAVVELSIVGMPEGGGDKGAARSEAERVPAGDESEYDPSAPDIAVEFARLAAEVPAEVWDELPADYNYQLDHYLYGTPKK